MNSMRLFDCPVNAPICHRTEGIESAEKLAFGKEAEGWADRYTTCRAQEGLLGPMSSEFSFHSKDQ